MSDSLDRMVDGLRQILAILVIAGWSDEQIQTLTTGQLRIAREDPEAAAPIIR